MTQYLLAIFQPDGELPAEILEPMMAELNAVNAEIKAAGGWLFSAGLLPPGTATVVRGADRDVLVTDGPFTEGKEHLGGVIVVEAPDLDVAIGWAGRMAAITGLAIEVRPAHHAAAD